MAETKEKGMKGENETTPPLVKSDVSIGMRRCVVSQEKHLQLASRNLEQAVCGSQ